MNRGDIYWVNLDAGTGSEINKIRPCVIISASALNKARRTVIVVPLSSNPTAKPPLLIPTHSMENPGVLVCDQIKAIDKNRLKDKISSLNREEMSLLEDSLRIILGL